MSEEQVSITLVIRPDQDRALKIVAKEMNVSISAVHRWAIDDALASLLIRAGLKESDLPKEARRTNGTN